MKAQLKTLKAKQRKVYKVTEPFLLLTLGLIMGAFVSEFVAVLHEMAKEKGGNGYIYYRWFILILVPVLLFYFWYQIKKYCLEPLDKIDQQVTAAELSQKKSK